VSACRPAPTTLQPSRVNSAPSSAYPRGLQMSSRVEFSHGLSRRLGHRPASISVASRMGSSACSRPGAVAQAKMLC
jgi:hypothetical protein